MLVGSKYPWLKWLDGRVWFVRHGHDYTCLTSSMQSGAYMAAKEAGVAVVTRDVGLGFLVQAYTYHSTWKPNLSKISTDKINRAASRSVSNER